MAEIRKHVPTTSGIGEQVRALLGETIRPVQPGSQAAKRMDEAADDLPPDKMFDPFAETVDEPDDLPTNVIPFRAGDDPLIGVLPDGFNPIVFDDDDDTPAA